MNTPEQKSKEIFTETAPGQVVLSNDFNVSTEEFLQLFSEVQCFRTFSDKEKSLPGKNFNGPYILHKMELSKLIYGKSIPKAIEIIKGKTNIGYVIKNINCGLKSYENNNDYDPNDIKLSVYDPRFEEKYINNSSLPRAAFSIESLSHLACVIAIN